MHKRGQMTLLIILGIVVVASVVLIYTFRANLLGSEWDTQRTLSLNVPDEAEELHSYIGDCIQEVGIRQDEYILSACGTLCEACTTLLITADAKVCIEE